MAEFIHKINKKYILTVMMSKIDPKLNILLKTRIYLQIIYTELKNNVIYQIYNYYFKLQLYIIYLYNKIGIQLNVTN